jgi:hypothetical protein
VASDKVIIFFAKHNNIGSVIVAKEICKNIDLLNKIAFAPSQPNANETEDDKKEVITRLYAIL